MEPSARLILARHVRWRRFAQGWSQEQLAEVSGMHRTYISAIERGRINPGLDALERLARALAVPLSELLERPHAP
ncbi:MAG: helix-turn-helix domain-containing protein [Acidiferrobacteraceae bacterium]